MNSRNQINHTSLNIKLLRMILGRTQEEFGKLIGCTGPYICQIENNEREVKAGLIERICEAYGVRPKRLFEGDGISDCLQSICSDLLDDDASLGEAIGGGHG